jgi:hypothetical protein
MPAEKFSETFMLRAVRYGICRRHLQPRAVRYGICRRHLQPRAVRYGICRRPLQLRAVRYGMSVENAGGLSNPVPSGTECDDSHIAYLTAREKWVTANFSTNILSLTGQRNFYMLFRASHHNYYLIHRMTEKLLHVVST